MNDSIKKIIGIYKIINKINGKCYIGSSSNIRQRWNSHKNLLVRQKHHNIKLQRSWNKYGKNNFEFVIIEVVNEDDLLLKEQIYLDKMKNNIQFIYNINFVANKPPSSIESRKKQSISMKGKIPWNKGKVGVQIPWNKNKRGISITTHIKLSENSKKRIGSKNSNYNSKKYTFKNIISNEIFVGTQNLFRKTYNIDQSSVSYLISGRYKSCQKWILIM